MSAFYANPFHWLYVSKCLALSISSSDYRFPRRVHYTAMADIGLTDGRPMNSESRRLKKQKQDRDRRLTERR
jgi:hypothetical protein